MNWSDPNRNPVVDTLEWWNKGRYLRVKRWAALLPKNVSREVDLYGLSFIHPGFVKPRPIRLMDADGNPWMVELWDTDLTDNVLYARVRTVWEARLREFLMGELWP